MKYYAGLIMISLSLVLVGLLLHLNTRDNSPASESHEISGLRSQQPLTAEAESRVSFLAVGDIMLSRHEYDEQRWKE